MKTLSLITTRGTKSEPALRQLSRGGSRSLSVQNMPYPGMDRVVEIIKKMIEEYRGKQFVRSKAMQITGSITKNARSGHPDMRNFDAIAKAIYDFVIDKTIYTRDPNKIERLQMPDATLMLGSGDCDDMVILSGALLESVGVPTRIRLLGESSNSFSHILLDYLSNGQWKSFDPTLALYPGFKIPKDRIKNEKVVSITRPGLAGANTPRFVSRKANGTGSSFVH